MALFIRAGRGVELTEAGRLFRPHAERTLAEAQAALESVREMRDAHRRHGRVRLLRRRPPHAAGPAGGGVPQAPPRRARARDRPELGRGGRRRARRAASRAALVDPAGRGHAGSRSAPARNEELLYVSADPERLERADDDRAPGRGAADPLRRPLGGAGPDPPRSCASAPSGPACRLEPLIEVEYMTAALDLAARGLGDTVGLASLLTARGYTSRLGTVAFDPPIDETFAFITRRNAHLTPATRAFMALAERRCRRWRRVRSTHGRRDRCRRGVSADDLLAARGRAADDGRQRGAGDAALGADRARDGRPARARRLHHPRRRQVDLVHGGRAASTPRRSSAATG